MHTEVVSYEADGLQLIGYLALPDRADPGPAVLVAHEGPGLDEHAKIRARRLADLGYAAFALDYNGGGRPMTMSQAGERIGGLIAAPERTRALGQAGLDILLAQTTTDSSRVAAIGYCFGGTVALEMARGGADLKAVVAFHAKLSTSRPQDATNITAKVLVCTGAEDPLVPPDERAGFEEEMRAGGVDWAMNLYGRAAHSFTNPDAASREMPGVEFHEPTDRRSWRAMLDLFSVTIDA